MGISDMIAEFIHTALETEEALELRRADLAERFGCVPSQVNYVIATRFSPEFGYIVESRRGGGGYIRIRRITVGRQDMLMHAVASIGSRIDPASAAAIVQNLCDAAAIAPAEARLIASALTMQALRSVPPELKSTVRADILKRMLMVTTATDDR